LSDLDNDEIRNTNHYWSKHSTGGQSAEFRCHFIASIRPRTPRLLLIVFIVFIIIIIIAITISIN